MSFTKVTCEASGGVWVPDAEVCTNKPQGQTGNQQQTGNGTKFGQTYFGGLLSGILGNLSLGFGQGAGQSLNPQQPQVIQQPAQGQYDNNCNYCGSGSWYRYFDEPTTH
jgi:hypothetical protein